MWIFSACGSLDHTPLYIPVRSVGGLEGGDVLEDAVAYVEYVGVGIESLECSVWVPVGLHLSFELCGSGR